MYTGSFDRGLKEGQGKMDYADGSVLSGQWARDIPSGQNMIWNGGPNHWLKHYEGGM